MSKLHWFKCYPSDFLGSKKVARMTAAQQGMYFRLLCFAWGDPDCSLPNDTEELKELALWVETYGDFRKVRECFTPHPDQPKRLHNSRLYQEWLMAKKKEGMARESALARWQKKPSLKPVIATKDREAKGLTQLSDTLSSIADKHFPPV